MKQAIARGFFVLITAALCTAGTVYGQDREKHIISARAGGVNFVTGDVVFQRRGSSNWHPLTSKDNLESGDVVKSKSGGLAEILLNPGSYIRLAGDAQLELVDASLDDIRVRLVSGSSVIEATGFDNIKLLIAVETPQTKVSVVKSGLYRVNVLPSGITEVIVLKGRAQVTDDPKMLVKGGKKARVGAGGVTDHVKFDKKERDAFDAWSKERAETLAEANRKLSGRNVNALLARVNFDNIWLLQSRSQASGLWLYDARRSCYTFLPYYQGWASPYGYSYTSGLAWSGWEGCANCPGGSRGYNRPVVGNMGGRTGETNPNMTAGRPGFDPSSGQQPGLSPAMGRPDSSSRDFSSPRIDRPTSVDRPSRGGEGRTVREH